MQIREDTDVNGCQRGERGVGSVLRGGNPPGKGGGAGPATDIHQGPDGVGGAC